jgi:hypothetical protein
VVNDLAHQASGFWSNREKLDVPVCHSGYSSLQMMHNAKILLNPVQQKPDVLKSETGGFGISRGSNDLGETAMIEP